MGLFLSYKNFIRIGEIFCNFPLLTDNSLFWIITCCSWLISTTTHAWPVFNECLFDSYDSYTVLSWCVCAHKWVCVLYWEGMMKHADIFTLSDGELTFSFHFSTFPILNSIPSDPSHQPERLGKCHSPPQTSSMTFPTSFTEKPRLQLTTPGHQTANQTINMIKHKPWLHIQRF